MDVTPVFDASKQPAKSPARFKLAAIDLDGTLLGPDLQISAENYQAIRALHARKIEIVIASGRHFLSVRPILQSLPKVHWIVSFQGAEISDRDRKVVLGRTCMDPAHVELALDQAIEHGLSPVVYGTDGAFTPLAHDDNLQFYLDLSGLRAVQISRENLAQIPVFKVLWLGQPEQITAVAAAPLPGLTCDRVQTHHRILEFMPHNVSKASGLQMLATHLNISPGETVVFGDADNDIPMFKWAGLSVAMAHGWPAAIAAASQASPVGPPATALARAIDSVITDADHK